MNKLSRLLVLAIAASSFLLVFSQRGIGSSISERYLNNPMLKPGEKIDDMVITTGIENAFPLWALCLPTKENERSISVDCGEVSFYPNLAIGHTFGVMDLIPASVDWEELNWEMFVDGHPIDLKTFGVYDFIHPDFPPSSSPIREVFRVLRVWDVVLENPTPGMHRLQGQAQPPDGAAPYTWIVNFSVAAQ